MNSVEKQNESPSLERSLFPWVTGLGAAEQGVWDLSRSQRWCAGRDEGSVGWMCVVTPRMKWGCVVKSHLPKH